MTNTYWKNLYNAGNGAWDSEIGCFVKINHPRKLRALLALREMATEEEIDIDYELEALCKQHGVTTDIHCCPVCQGRVFKETYDNVGFDEPNGPVSEQLISSVCTSCGYDLCK